MTAPGRRPVHPAATVFRRRLERGPGASADRRNNVENVYIQRRPDSRHVDRQTVQGLQRGQRTAAICPGGGWLLRDVDRDTDTDSYADSNTYQDAHAHRNQDAYEHFCQYIHGDRYQHADGVAGDTGDNSRNPTTVLPRHVGLSFAGTVSPWAFVCTEADYDYYYVDISSTGVFEAILSEDITGSVYYWLYLYDSQAPTGSWVTIHTVARYIL